MIFYILHIQFVPMIKYLILILLLLVNCRFLQAQNHNNGIDSLLSVLNSEIPDSVRISTGNQLGEAYLNVAIEYSFEDNMDSTLYFLFKSLEVYENNHNLHYQSIVISDISLTFSNYDMMPQAFDYMERSIALCNAIHDTIQLARNYFILGLANMNLNVYQVAKDYFSKSLELYEYLDNEIDELLVKTSIAKNDFYIAQHYDAKSLNEACKNEYSSLKAMIVNDDVVIDYLNYCYAFISDFFTTMRVQPVDSLKDYYISGMKYFYNSAEIYSDYTSWFDTRRQVSKFYISMAEGKKLKAKKELNAVKDKNCVEYYEAAYWYYMEIADYKHALENYDLMNKYETRTFNAETSMRYERNRAQANYEDKIQAIENQAKQQKLEFELQSHNSRIHLYGVLVFLLLILAILFNILYQKRMANTRNKILRSANHEIMEHNSEIQIINEEIRAQTEALLSLNEQVENHRARLKDANENMLRSIKMAEQIQLATIPSQETMNNIFGSCFVYWRPRNIVSGDFYWATQIGDVKYLVTADCTGHGVPGALLSILGISILNDISHKFPELNAGEILDLMKARFISALSENQNMYDGIEMSLLCINRDKMKVQFAGAKRPLYLVRNYQLIDYKPDYQTIAHDFLRANYKFTNREIDIEKGDMLYTFTDGIPDQVGGDTGIDKLSLPSLRDLLSEISGFPVMLQKEILHGAILSHLAASIVFVAEQIDDQLMIGVRI